MPRRRLATLLWTAFLLLWMPRTTALSAQAPADETGRLGAEEIRQGLRQMIASARDRVFPSLVHIDVIAVRYVEGRELRVRRQGSGTLISAEGHVLTNEHVVQRGVQFRCTLTDREKVTAELVGEDPLTDLAVLKINKAELADGGRNLPVARFGDSAALEIGDYVMAMGSPYSLSRSVTLGIVSNTTRVLPPELLSGNQDEMELEPGQTTGLYTLWIQHDALINPGNSGGPLVGLAGDIVGVNEMGGAAIGFAIPSNLARRVAGDLISHGEVTRSWIGASFRPTADTGVSDGVLVDSVTADSPAARAGIQAGDVLLSLNGEPVNIRFPEEVPPLLSRIADTPVGTAFQVTYRREAAIRKAQIATEKLVRDRGEEGLYPDWGFTAQQVTQKMARELEILPKTGVLVTGIRSGSPAHLAQPPLASGDLLQTVAGTQLHSLEDLAAEYQKAQKASPQTGVLVAFDRRGKSYLTLLKPRNPSEAAAAPREILKPWMGIATQPILGEIGETLGSADARGYRITRVYPSTAASAAGLRVGDIILAIDHERLVPRDLEDSSLLDRRIRSLEIGQTIGLTILRDGKTDEKTVGLERNLITPPEARRELNGDLGLTAREMTFFDSDENGWSRDVHGVIVEEIEPAGSAALAGLRLSDLIQKIGGRDIRDLQGFREALMSIAAARPQRLPVIVLRGAGTHLLFIETAWGLGDATPEE